MQYLSAEMRLIKKFTLPDFQAKFLHCQFHLISTVLVMKAQKIGENGVIYTASKNLTLPPAVTGRTNLTSV